MTNCILEGGDVINYTLDLHISDKPATYYVDPFWEGIEQRDLLKIELQVHIECNNPSSKSSLDIFTHIQVDLMHYWLPQQKRSKKQKR